MKKNILLIGPFPPPVSGVSIANKIIANGLIKNKWKVGIINSEYSINLTSKHGKISLEKLYFIKTYFSLIKVFSFKIIYITIGQSFFGVLKYLPFIFLARIANKKLIVHLHGNHLLNEYNTLEGIKKNIFTHLISSFDYGIVLSTSLRNNFEPFLKKENIFVLNNFFEESLKIPDEILIPKKNFKELKVVFLSNLIQEKGINILLEAIRVLEKKGVVVKLKVAGSIIKDNDLSQYFNELKQVEYVGVVHGKEKQDLLVWSNVFCLPTFYKMEGQPISILEAMALGNLILTTKHAGITDVCKDENAIFCDKESVKDLVQKLEFLSNNLLQVAEKGLFNIEYSNKMFSEEKFIDNANEILLKCIN